jgi:Tfp pilus assembly protein PilN
MIQINLLPKEYRKKNQFFSFKKGTLYALAGAGALVVLMLFATTYQTWKIKSIDTKMREAKERTEKLKKDIQLVDALTEVREKLLLRMNAIENLDKYRSVWINIMQDLSGRIPNYLWLSGFKEEQQVMQAAAPTTNTLSGLPSSNPLPQQAAQAPDTIRTAGVNFGPRKATIDGHCYSINSLAAFLINLTRSNYIKNVELKFIRSAQQDKQKYFTFQLGCDLIYYIEPPSFAQAEQGIVPSPSGTPEPPTDEAAAQEEIPEKEPGQSGQSSLDSQEDEKTLAHKASSANQTEKIIP